MKTSCALKPSTLRTISDTVSLFRLTWMVTDGALAAQKEACLWLTRLYLTVHQGSLYLNSEGEPLCLLEERLSDTLESPLSPDNNKELVTTPQERVTIC